MIIVYQWRGAGIVVLVAVPIVIAIEIILSVNLIGRDFTKTYFREIVIAGIAVAGLACLMAGRWLNRVRDGQNYNKRLEINDSLASNAPHQMWGIAVQHWCWIYMALAIVIALVWESTPINTEQPVDANRPLSIQSPANASH
jgi:hypothetical protein